MNHRIVVFAAALVLATALVFVAAPLQTAEPSPASLIPAGPLLVLEAKDFAHELGDWNQSREQKAWLESIRFQAFSQSRLYLRLKEAWDQFNEAAGFAADSTLLASIAGRESALALYDIGDLTFLYVTRLPSSRAMQTVLWESRLKYETRNAGGNAFYVRRGANREVAFGAAGDWLIIGTREEFVAGALRLQAHEDHPAVRQEAWYAQAGAAAGAPGDLRLTMNLDTIVKSPHFRSYWIQRNVSEIKPYWSGLSDLRRTAGEIREDRVLLRRAPTPAVASTPLDIVRLAPNDSGFYQAWANPDTKAVAALIENKLFTLPAGRVDSGRYAPGLDTQSSGPGEETDLETRIDQPVLKTAGPRTADALAKFLAAARLHAVLQIGSARVPDDAIFVRIPAVITLQAEQPWDEQAVRQTLTDAAANLWTFAGIGAGWTLHTRAGTTWYSCDGPAHLNFAVSGNLLMLANASEDLEETLDRLSTAGTHTDAVYRSVFRHAQQRGGYDRIMGMLDSVQSAPIEGGQTTRFSFFSADLASLSTVFARVAEVSVEIRDAGSSLREQVRYRTP